MSEIAAFEKRVADYVKRHGRLNPQADILVACSGGPDSVALLYWLAWWQASESSGRGRLAVAVVDHSLRPESVEEVALVQAHADHLHIPCYTMRFDAKEAAKASGQSIETVSRERRYAFLYETAHIHGYTYIATAHHRDDQAESILAHILRGSGTKGLQGMKLLDGELWRPFLGVTKKEIATYVADKQLTVAHDKTNELPMYARNRLRLEIIPMLKQINPAVTEALVRLGEAAAMDEDFLRAEVARRATKLERVVENGIQVNRQAFLKESAAVRYRLWRRWFWMIASQIPSAAHAEIVERMAHNGGDKQFSVGQVKVSVQYDIIQVERLIANHAKDVQTKLHHTVCIEAVECVTGNGAALMEHCRTNTLFMVPAVMAPDGVEVRTRRAGDRIYIVDATGQCRGRKKLKDWCIDRKIPRQERDTIMFLAAKDSNTVFGPATADRPVCIRSESEATYIIGAFKEVESC